MILNNSDDDCEKPIRAWVVVWVCMLAVSFVGGTILRLLQVKYSKAKQIYIAYGIFFIIILLFNLTWIIVGSVWLFSDDDCEDGIS